MTYRSRHISMDQNAPFGLIAVNWPTIARSTRRSGELSPAAMRRSSSQAAGRLAGSLASEKAGRLSRMPAAKHGEATSASAKTSRDSIEHFRIVRVISRDGYESRKLPQHGPPA